MWQHQPLYLRSIQNLIFFPNNPIPKNAKKGKAGFLLVFPSSNHTTTANCCQVSVLHRVESRLEIFSYLHKWACGVVIFPGVFNSLIDSYLPMHFTEIPMLHLWYHPYDHISILQDLKLHIVVSRSRNPATWPRVRVRADFRAEDVAVRGWVHCHRGCE